MPQINLKSRLSRWFRCLATLAFLFLSPGCSEDPLPPSPPPPGDYFPTLALNQSLYWSFHQETERSAGIVPLTWTGVLRWDVVGVNSNSDTTIYSIRRIFSGKRIGRGGGAAPSDTLYIAADTSTFSLRQIGDSVFIPLAGNGQYLTYVGPTLRFREPHPADNPDTVTIGENTSLRISVRKDIGLVRVWYWLGCNSCDIVEPNRFVSGTIPSMESDDYFPGFVLGDSLSWDFRQTYYNTQSDWTTWEGVVEWRVTGVASTGMSTRFQIEREFTGRQRHYAGSADTSFISGDKSVLVVEDSGRTVRIPFSGNGSEVTYYGPDLTFQRYFPVRYGDTLVVTQDHYLDVTFCRREGIVAADYTDWRVPNYGGIPGYQFTYTRRR